MTTLVTRFTQINLGWTLLIYRTNVSENDLYHNIVHHIVNQTNVMVKNMKSSINENKRNS